MEKALALQNSYLKGKELLQFMSALTPFSELPHPFDKPFQPEPDFRYGWLLNEATASEALRSVAGPIADLDAYATGMNTIVNRISGRIEMLRSKEGVVIADVKLFEELERGLRITALRAAHRSLTLRALLAKREEHAGKLEHTKKSEPLLAQAYLLRQRAQFLVQAQESIYRYPNEQVARRRPSMTAYSFGYLYPASRLFFWEREELQVRHERFDALFMNLWDMRRTLGLESLFHN